MPIRVLHVVTYMGRGGLETMIMNYYRHIDRSQVQFDFLVHREFEADYDAEILSLGGKIYRLPKLNPFSINYLNELDRFFATHKDYQIVHSHLDCMAGLPLKYAKKYGIPVRIAHAHNSNQTKDNKYLLKLMFKRNICCYATDLFACSQAAGQWMFHTDRFHVMNNAIDASAYAFCQNIRREMRSAFGFKENTLVVGHVGRFMEQKNHKYLLRIFSTLPENARLLLVGDGELRNYCEELADELGIRSRITFAGIRGDVNRLLQAMDVFVFPSLYEGLPVSIIEAQAAGLPCIISDKVPIECKKTELVQQIPLNAGAKVWADAVFAASSFQRRNTSEEIRKAGFDIVYNAQWLQSFYLKKWGTDYESEI